MVTYGRKKLCQKDRREKAKPRGCLHLHPEIASKFRLTSHIPENAQKLPGIDWLQHGFKLNGKPVFEQVADGDAKYPMLRFLYDDADQWRVFDPSDNQTYFA